MLSFSADLRHRIVAGIAAVTLCAGTLSEVDAHLSDEEPQTSKPIVHLSRSAERLIARLDQDLPADVIEQALQQKQKLLERSVFVGFTNNMPKQQPPAAIISLQKHPDWIVFDDEKKTFVVDERSIRFFLDNPLHTMFPHPSDAIALPDEHDEMRVRIEGAIQDGYVIDAVSAAHTIAQALESGEAHVRIPLTFREGSVYLFTDSRFKRLSLLSHGLSDFTGSPYGRAANIRKALDHQLNGIVLNADESFSFNDAMLGNSGWNDALVIGEGGVLTPEPGGGICQAATTVYRAALLAGLPVTERANHSLYVTYYERYGVGIDATVYAGKQDLTFKNDTGAPVVMLARHNGTEAYVDLYGVADGRTATLDGPYFSATSANESLFAEKPLRINQIGWKYAVTYADGTTKEEPVVSTYKAIPKRLKAKYVKEMGTGSLIVGSAM
jgi:vancomycin resistance protein YoaR